MGDSQNPAGASETIRGIPKILPELPGRSGDCQNPAGASGTISGIAKIVTTKRGSLHNVGGDRLGPSVKLIKTSSLSDS
jgi:hypothetical protein